MVDVCGFFDLDEARTARRQLQDEQLHADILIRERGEDEGALQEEYWLRVEATGARAAAAMFPHEEEHPGAGLVCGQCGAEVATDATVCPRCGGRFEEP
jgi:ribosomal protein L40E